MVHLFKELLKHNQAPLEITTFDGSNSPYHPSVLCFNTPWNGYSFWMANTPYPHKTTPYRDRYECPSICVSKDGFHWDCANKPIADLTDEEIKDYDYLSDPHLLKREDTIECWYRLTKRHGKHNYSVDNDHYLLRKQTTDGTHWTDSETVIDISKTYGREMVSPALLYQDGYKMWIVDLEDKGGNGFSIDYLTSEDCKKWSEIKSCQLKGREINPWHIDIQFFDGNYWLTCYEKLKDLTLWKSSDGINFEYVSLLLTPSHSIASFYGRMLYRACLTKVCDNDYRLYFSAEDDFSAHIGVMQGTSPTSMKVVAVDGKEFRRLHNLIDLCILHLRGLKASFSFKLKMKISQL